jgi:multidrug resistance efflux pump
MPSTPSLARIPRSPAVKWRRLRAQTVPVLVFFAAAGTCAWLWSEVGGTVSAVAKVEAPRVDVASPAAATVVALPNQAGGQWSLYEHVRAGEVIAVLEDQAQTPAKVIEVRAPISGTLIGVHCWPGQTVIPGGPIASIAADYGRNLVAYLPEESPIDVQPGTRVTLRPRIASGRTYTSEVDLVARQVEPLPRHQWTIPTVPQWGIPVRIKMPDDAMLAPGSLVDLQFRATSTP